jgi:hypothetical protein
MRLSIFWNFTQHILVVRSRRFEINDRSHLQGSSSLLAESYWRFGNTYRSHLQESIVYWHLDTNVPVQTFGATA